ncbi:dephospho-CoA kinase [Lacticaseibacillus thailandensis]|uniref:Dephospho-CoA kinase n=1 Tax=Lacticaseibacillus thailandensis DSM 22698 = JCM 13996 TaxID=1423810 RepID=A0A0R2CB36_9LACO|nr:dephospho-CoA kinase [Lacticaseibacillus thailandensis]KRM88322.1 dephospho-CoA kinase [Lacticaseibacillus thailandensis DSM 22698 = JCM 13996]
MTYKLGITGGIATGKTTVANDFRAAGYPVIDVDGIARAVAVPGSKILAALQHEFGSMIIQGDGTLNRGLLAKVVFGHPRRLKRLNDIMQPAIRAQFERELKRAVGTGADLVVADVPLLYEQHYEDYFDGIAVVTVPAQRQQERLAVRDGLTVNEALARINSQLPLDEKVARANFAINTDVPAELRRVEVQQLIAHILNTQSL